MIFLRPLAAAFLLIVGFMALVVLGALLLPHSGPGYFLFISW